jgi:uncharacterized protein YkwD
MSPRRWFPVLTVPWLLVATLVAPAHAQTSGTVDASAARLVAADPGLESDFVGRINSLRASKGLNALQVSSPLVGVARGWTDQMVAAGEISHNPNLSGAVAGGWTKLGENVGVGYDVNGLMQAFVASPAHYANLVDPVWTHVGVGVTRAGDGRIYTTHNFMALGGGAPPPPAPPTTAPPAPAPKAPAAPAPPAPPPPPPPPPPAPHPTPDRATAVLDPLRSLEAG